MKTRRILIALFVGLGLFAIAMALLPGLEHGATRAEGLRSLAFTLPDCGAVITCGQGNAAGEISAQYAFTPTWVIERVDSSGSAGTYGSLALDSNGNPHMSYADNENYVLKHAWLCGPSWCNETVTGTVRGVGDTSLALDGSDSPHITYYDWTFDLRYARFTNSAWVIEIVDESLSNVGGSDSLALDGEGRPHVSYYRFDNGSLAYAWLTDTHWYSTTVDGFYGVGKQTSLALDHMGYPHISYYAYDSSRDHVLKYAWWSGTGWITQSLDSGLGDMGWGGDTALALDSSDRPHIAYYSKSQGDLKYAWLEGATWYSTTVDSDGDVGSFLSLALNPHDQPCISYYDATNTRLKYACWTGSAWQMEVVDAEGDVGAYASLALDSRGDPVISYYDATNGDLKLAWRARTGAITPDGGELNVHTLAQFAFPPGAVTEAITITFTALEPFGVSTHVGTFFDIAAVYQSNGQPAQLAAGQTYTVVAHYDASALPAGMSEAGLALYFWTGSAWVREPSSMVDIVADTVVATPGQFGQWAVLVGGGSNRIYLPVVRRGS